MFSFELSNFVHKERKVKTTPTNQLDIISNLGISRPLDPEFQHVGHSNPTAHIQ